jgi:hypothetical protein
MSVRAVITSGGKDLTISFSEPLFIGSGLYFNVEERIKEICYSFISKPNTVENRQILASAITQFLYQMLAQDYLTMNGIFGNPQLQDILIDKTQSPLFKLNSRYDLLLRNPSL